jgi:hypothetical protein
VLEGEAHAVAVVAMHHFIIKFLGELTLQGYSCGGQQWNGRFLYRPSGCLFLRQLLKTSSGYLSVPSYQFWQNANASYTTRSIRVKKDAKKFTVHKDNIFLPSDPAKRGVQTKDSFASHGQTERGHPRLRLWSETFGRQQGTPGVPAWTRE